MADLFGAERQAVKEAPKVNDLGSVFGDILNDLHDGWKELLSQNEPAKVPVEFNQGSVEKTDGKMTALLFAPLNKEQSAQQERFEAWLDGKTKLEAKSAA